MSKNELVHIETRRCIIRFPTVEEARNILEYYNKNRVRLSAWEPDRPDEFYTLDYWIKRIQRNFAEYFYDKSLNLGIFLRDGNQFVGVIRFSDFQKGSFLNCKLGYSLSLEYEGRGLMLEALSASIDYVFTELGYHRIEANYNPENRRSEKLLSSLGFERHGIARNYIKIGGKWTDHVLTSKRNSKLE